MNEYVKTAVKKHSLNLEQAIVLLFLNNWNVNESLKEIDDLVQMPDEWTKEDKIVFEQAFMFHGKNFNKIKLVVRFFFKFLVCCIYLKRKNSFLKMPEKSLPNLVSYYYTWKKTRNYLSLIESQANAKNTNNFDENGDLNGLSSPYNLLNNSNDSNQSDNESIDENYHVNFSFSFFRKIQVFF